MFEQQHHPSPPGKSRARPLPLSPMTPRDWVALLLLLAALALSLLSLAGTKRDSMSNWIHNIQDDSEISALKSKLRKTELENAVIQRKLEAALQLNVTIRQILKEINFANNALNSLSDENVNKDDVDLALKSLDFMRSRFLSSFIPKLSDLKLNDPAAILRSLPASVSKCSSPGTVAFIFQDGPFGTTPCTNRECSAQGLLLDALDALEISASFFPTGVRVQQWPEFAIDAVRRGHHVGSHGFTHRSVAVATSPDEALVDMDQMEFVLRNATGYRPFTYLPSNDEVHGSIISMYQQRGYTVVDPQALIRPFDSTFENPDELAKELLRLITESVHVDRLGRLVLLSLGHKPTVDALKMIVPTLRQEHVLTFGKIESCF